MTELKKGNGKKKLPTSVTFHYLKSAQYRVTHIDGAIGGLTPTGFVHMSMFSERFSIPKEQIISINEKGGLGDLKQETTMGGVVRELEVSALMSIDVAKSLMEWLTRQIAELEKRKG